MPVYEYMCSSCLVVQPVLRKIANRDDLVPCPECALAMPRIASKVAVKTWNPWRRFPNLSSTSHDGAAEFESEADYKAHLRENDQVELSQGGLVMTPHGNKVLISDRPEEQPSPYDVRDLLSEEEISACV